MIEPASITSMLVGRTTERKFGQSTKVGLSVVTPSGMVRLPFSASSQLVPVPVPPLLWPDTVVIIIIGATKIMICSQPATLLLLAPGRPGLAPVEAVMCLRW
jgi:hypothetical protein